MLFHLIALRILMVRHFEGVNENIFLIQLNTEGDRTLLQSLLEMYYRNLDNCTLWNGHL